MLMSTVWLRAAAVAAPLVLAGAGCADDDDAGATATDTEVALGAQLVGDLGCAGCHGPNGEGLVGPSWIGLAGSTVELEDGTTVTADADYLRVAIVDPDRDRAAGMVLSMPPFDLPEFQLNAIVAYIESLS